MRRRTFAHLKSQLNVSGNPISLRRGFVLLTVLMLVTLGALLLTRYSLQSLRMAAQSQRTLNAMSDRWARWSAIQVGMSQAEKVLGTGGPNGEPIPAVELGIPIQDQTFYLRIVDLDCAVNVNTVARQSGVEGVRRLLGNSFVGFEKNTIAAPQGQGQRLIFDSWGKLLRLDSLSEGSDVGTELQNLHEHITCWGSGQLNIRRCSDDSLSVLGTAISRKGLMDTIRRERSNKPDASLNELIAKSARGGGDAEMLRSLLRDSSTAWCVTISGSDAGADLLLIREAGFGQFADRTSVFALR